MCATTTLKVGLTGGIGSGKSTVALLLCRTGGVLIDADAISRAATAPYGSAIEQIKHAFGNDMITAKGTLDRNKMRRLIFDDPEVKIQLESIIHPLVHREIAIQSSVAEASGAAYIVFDIPLLVESKRWRDEMHRIIVVDCSVQTQTSRVVVRDDLALAAIEKIISVQVSRDLRIRAADMVLFNDGISLQVLAAQVQQIGIQLGL